MIKSIISIDDYWKVVLFIEVDYDKYEEIEKELNKIGISKKLIEDIYNKIGYIYNSGVTVTKMKNRTSVVCVNKTTNLVQLINTICHEAYHVQVAICDYYDIPRDTEDAAYLMGYIVDRFYKSCSRLFCEC